MYTTINSIKVDVTSEARASSNLTEITKNNEAKLCDCSIRVY